MWLIFILLHNEPKILNDDTNILAEALEMRKQNASEIALSIDATRHNLELFIMHRVCIDVFHVRLIFQATQLFCFFLKTDALRNLCVSAWQDLHSERLYLSTHTLNCNFKSFVIFVIRCLFFFFFFTWSLYKIYLKILFANIRSRGSRIKVR